MRLKELRKFERKTQLEIAAYLNLSQTSYGRYELETSEPTIDTLCKLADYYKVSLDYLVERNFNVESDLTSQERELLSNFKKLEEIDKAKALAYITGLFAAKH